jgi:Acyl-coenzyme A:6-aminopenicillanic acid acyl-transferase
MRTRGSINSDRTRTITRTIASALLTTFLTTASFSGLSNACTLMGANGTATADGHVYLASTSDNPYIEGPRNQVYLTIPKEGFKFVHTPLHIQDPPGHYFDVGSDRGMNEKGFSWTRAWVVPNEPQAANKMNAVDWFLKMGSTVATVDEAIKFVQDNPKGIGDQGNYIFADADGNMAAVEVGYQSVNVVQKWTKGEKGVAARANLWTSDKMKPIDISNTADEHDHQYAVSTGYRVPRAMELLNGGAGKINVDTLKQFLADNDNRDKAAMGDTGFSISNHGATGGTVAAEIYDPANRTFWFTYGWPDGDAKSSNPSFDGANKNTWGAWIPFVISEMTEEGYYTDWNGNITPMGARYLARLNAKHML